MAKNESKEMQLSEQEAIPGEELERTRERQCFVPKTDIFETNQEIVLVADIPGVGSNSLDITLEKNVLTIEAIADSTPPEGYKVTYSEYDPGDFRRQFRLAGEIDQDHIEATVTDGVLRLKLPKAEIAKVKKIPIKAGK